MGTLEKKFILLDITNLTGNLHTIPFTNFRCSSKQKVFFVHKSVNSVISHEMGHLSFSFLFVGIIGVKKEQNQYKARWRKTLSLGGHQRESKIDQGPDKTWPEVSLSFYTYWMTAINLITMGKLWNKSALELVIYQ